jgi:steroid delta-isomerase-like uncharacterized protein
MTDAAALVRSYLAAFAAGDPDAIAAHVSDDFVNDHASALGARSDGAAAYRHRLPDFLASMPELRYDVTRVVADGDTVVAAYTLSASPDGRPVEVRGIMLCEVVDGRIAARTDYWDSLGFLRQTGQA